MAFWKRRSRGSFAPSSNDRFAAVYLGRQPVADDGGSGGLDQASPALDSLYRAYKEGKEPQEAAAAPQRVTVEVIVTGLVVNKIKGFSAPPSPGDNHRVLLAADRMHFGATDPARPRVFFVVVRQAEDPLSGGDGAGKACECHAFLCDSPTAARTLTLQLVEVFGNIGNAQTKLAYQRSTDYAAAASSSSSSSSSYQHQQGYPHHLHQQQHHSSGLLRTQSLNLQRGSSRGRSGEAVSALKITLNVEHQSSSLSPAVEANNNSQIAHILAKQDQAARSAAAAVGPRKGGDGSPSSVPLGASPADKGGSSPGGGGAALPGAGGSAVESQSPSPRAFHQAKPADSPPGGKQLTMRSKATQQQPLATIKDQSPCPSPKSSPKDRKITSKEAVDTSEDSKENRQIQGGGGGDGVTDRANKRKSVRFADDAEII